MNTERLARGFAWSTGCAVLVWAASRPLGAQVTAPRHTCLTAEQREILSHLSIEYVPDGLGGQLKTIRVTGVNVQIVNGLGNTDSTNGLGNLIVGYNELGNPAGDVRVGSHNVCIGVRDTYSSYGGIVVGQDNAVTGAYSSVTGGRNNLASGVSSHISGGGGDYPIGHVYQEGNLASGPFSSVSGGVVNVASGRWDAVSGGNHNLASGGGSSVSGGQNNIASGPSSWAAGGLDNDSGGYWTSAIGGYNNWAADGLCLGGSNNQAFIGGSCVGGDGNIANGLLSTVTGGSGNTASGTLSSVSGGLGRTATSDNDWVAGSLSEDQ